MPHIKLDIINFNPSKTTYIAMSTFIVRGDIHFPGWDSQICNIKA